MAPLRRVLARLPSWIAASTGALALTLVLCAPVRTVTGLGLPWATLVGLALSTAVVALVRRQARPGGPSRVLGTAALVAIAVAALWNRAIGPLGAWVGSDAGVHVSFRDAFVASDPGAYSGFVSLYGATWWIEKIGRTDAVWGFGLTFFACVVIVAATLGWCVDQTLGPEAGPTRRGLAWLVAAVVLLGLVLPLLNYHQVDGFLTQIWGLLPVLAIWRLDASTLPRWTRLGLQLGAVVWARYCYGLVMADLLAVVVVLAVGEVLEAARPRRGLVGALALLVVLGAGYAGWRFFAELVALVPKYGYFVRYDLELATQGAGLACAGVLVVLVAVPSLRRLLRVPVTIAVSNTIAATVLELAFPSEHYYLQKYGFHAIVCAALAVAAVAAYALGAAGEARRLRALGASLALVGLVTVGVAWKLVYPIYLERVRAPRVYQHLQPLVDFDARRRVRQRLRADQARFGGYLVAFGPMFNFMNAMFGREAGGFFDYRGVDAGPGACVFWTPTGLRGWAPWGVPQWLSATVRKLENEPRTECRGYPAQRALGRNLLLCGTCF